MTSLQKLFLLKEIANKLDSKDISKLENIFIKNIIEILKNGYIDQERDIKNNIEEILYKKNGSNIINFSKYIENFVNQKELNHILQYLKKKDYIQIKEIKNKLLKYETEFNLFDEQFYKALRYSIFEFSVTSLVAYEREDLERFIQERYYCPNLTRKLLFHGTTREDIPFILTSHFKLSNKDYLGINGVFFSDNIDYSLFYEGEYSMCGYGEIPDKDKEFTMIISSTYYDKNLFHNCNNYFKYAPKKNEIYFYYANFYGEANYPKKGKFFGTEYIIPNIGQICPFIGAKLKRVEYCIILGGSNILNKQNKEIMKFTEKNTEFNIYRSENILEALELVKIKKYNKIILISIIENNLEGLKFIDEARKIIKNDVIALFISYNTEHLKNVTQYKNALFSNQAKFYEEYLQCFSEDDTEQIKKRILVLKNSIEKHYNTKFNFNNDFLFYPLYKNSGKYEDLIIEVNNEEQYDPWTKNNLLKLKNINSKFIMRKNNIYDMQYPQFFKNKYEKNEKSNLSEIIHRQGYKLDFDKIERYFIQISIGLFHLKLNNIQITNLNLEHIFLDKEENAIIDINAENFFENEFLKNEKIENIDTLFLGCILY